MKRTAILSGLMLLAGLVQLSCESPSGPVIPPEILWNRFHPASYAVDERLSCFCGDVGYVVRLTVRDDSIAGAINTATGAPLSPSRWARYKTIDELFAIIDAAALDTFMRVEARYDSIYGYPTWVSVDPIPGLVDDEYAYTIGHLNLFPPFSRDARP